VTLSIGDRVYVENGRELFEVVGFELGGRVVKLAGRRLDLFTRDRFSVYAWRVGTTRAKRRCPHENPDAMERAIAELDALELDVSEGAA
jgi:hypothetical protein